ncbi:hypothetical protein DES52_10728 [Deinococcus yavapaiensis KR-236]|uniref:Uncharacterized protein n=2 Tax=Deinococcus TaxID=1298 RepID=A0A318SBN9_9DEIO|nr:hypothetical protein DES52_10728 [Deinococcus yavapaiensis KR-236]
MGVERSAQAAAREAGVPLSTMTSRIRVFSRHGLLARTGEQARRGRPMPLYRAPRSLYVPFHVTPLVSDQLLSSASFEFMQRRLMQSVGAAWVEAAEARGWTLGLHVFRDASGFVAQNVSPRPAPGEDPNVFFEDLLSAEQPAVWDTWGIFALHHEAAKAFQRELLALKMRYAALIDPSASRSYIVRLAIAPLVEEE